MDRASHKRTRLASSFVAPCCVAWCFCWVQLCSTLARSASRAVGAALRAAFGRGSASRCLRLWQRFALPQKQSWNMPLRTSSFALLRGAAGVLGPTLPNPTPMPYPYFKGIPTAKPDSGLPGTKSSNLNPILGCQGPKPRTLIQFWAARAQILEP